MVKLKFLFLITFLAFSTLYSQEIKYQPFSSKGNGVTKTKVISVTQAKALNVSNCCANLSNSFNNQSLINTFYPPQNNQTVSAGSTTIILDAVPPVDVFGNSFGDAPIQAGDLLLVVQMQGAEFNSMNSVQYGAGQTNSGPDFLGATGYTSLQNCGNYEYVIALNSVPLSGGILQIDNTCSGGLQNTYENFLSTSNNVIKRFQVVRVPRFQNLILNNDILTTSWNGSVGGLIVLNIAETFNLNGFKIDASGKGFRGGFQNARPSGITDDIITTFDNNLSSGKGEGISGTPRFMWNGINAVDYGLAWVGYPGGDYGRGAPGNAGAGGNAHNAGGGGGGNGGSGGVGGNGIERVWGVDFPNGGRPGIQVPNIPNKIFLGGGGGGGDANDATTGVKGGPGGGIIMINAQEIIGNGQILSNGFNGEPGVFAVNPDGAGGGGSGGSILILTSQSSNNTSINIQSKGGKGGNTLYDLSDPHGPGGGGGGGIVMHNLQNSILNIDVSGGLNGLTGNGSGISHGSSAGQNGIVVDYTTSGVLPALLNSLYPNPKAQFDVNDICLGEIITPNNTSNVLNIYNSSIVSYNWNFGDGTTSNLINPSHLYNQFGTFTITLTVLTNWGCSDTYTQIINVSNSTTPNFTQISPITCGNNFILPTISNNGITGTWTPVINNSLTSVYTFTPLTGQCANSTSMTIDVILSSSPTGTSTQIFCNSATIADLVATGSNIRWYSNASGGNPLQNTTSLINGGTYYASQTVNGCESPQRFSVEVTINPSITPTFESVAPICYGDFITALPTISIEGIPGIWSPSINNTQTTTYTFSPTSGTCINSATMTILVSAIPPGNQPGPLYYCDPNNDGFGVFDLTQVIPIVIGQNDMDVSFHETVTDAENDLTFIPNPSNYYNISVDNQTIYIRVESTDQSVFVSGTGSYVGGVFSSFPPGLQINTVDGTISPTNSAPGTYTVTYTTPASPNCPSTTSSTTVTISELPSASISYNDLPFCTSSNFQPVNLVGSGGVFSSTSGISIDTITGVVNPSESIPGTYIVTYTIPASGGCEEVKTSTQVTINDSPKAQISYSNPSFCVSVNGTQLPLLTGSDSSTASYLGGVYLAGVGLSIDSVTGAINPSTSIPGLYTVAYSTNIDPANPNCQPVIATTQVTINPLPTATISYATPFCSTDISKVVNLVGSGGTFSSTTGLTIDPGNGTISPSLSIPGNYTVSYIIPASNGCNAVTATTSVTITPAPSVTISYSNSPFCKSISTPQTATFTGTSGGVYSSSTGLTIDSTSGAIIPSSSTTGNYSVLYTIAPNGGCPAFTASTVVAINAIIAPIINCGISDNNSVSFTWDAIPEVDNYAVSYSVNSGSNTTLGPIGNLQSYVVSGLNPLDTVTITVMPIAIDPNNTCYTSSSITCTATNCLPSSATISYPSSPFCSSSSLESVTISGSNSGTFSSSPGLTIDINSGAINPSVSAPGTYTISYTIIPASANCPAFITTATVVINNSPTVSISYSSSQYCKSISTSQPVTPIVSGATFASTAGLVIDSITGEIQPSGSVVGTYTITYTIPAIGACQPEVVSTQVEIIDSPTATISYPSPICSNDTTPKLVTLTGTSGGIFTSGSGLTIDSNTGTITPNTSAPGTYTITYTIPANNGCNEVVSNASLVITQLPSAGINYDEPFCSNDNSIQDVTIIPGLGMFSGGSFSAIPSGLSINPLSGSITPIMSNPGTYTVTYTIPASAGCPSVPVSTNVKITPLPSATISYSNILCSCVTFCQTITTNQFVTLNLSSSTVIAGLFTAEPAGLSINSIDGSIIPGASLPGTYTVTYTIPAYEGCGAVSTSTTLVIQELSTLQPNVISNDTSMDLTWNALPGATGYTLSYSVNNGPNIIVVLTGNILSYSITGINIGDLVNFDITPIGNVPCYVPPGSGSSSGSIYYPPSYYLNCASAQISYIPMCISQTLVPVNITGTNTYLAGTYSAPLGVSIDSVTGAINPSLSTPGTYTVTYTIDSTIINNCICPLVIATTQVTINPLPTASISYASPFCSTDISKVVNLVGSGGAFSSTTGLTIDPGNGTISPSLSIPGNYTVSYIIPASNGCNAITATTSVTITPAPSAAISYSDSPFCKSINTPQIPSFTGSLGGVFSSSAGLSIVSSSGAITPASSTVGNYSVLYTIDASGGCPAYTTSTVVNVNPIIAPIINCGVSDNNSVSFTWDVIQGFDNYTVSYQINSGTNINVGQIGNVQSYVVSGLNPLDTVTITVMPIPIDPNNTCYTSSSITCTATNCLPSSATISYPSSPFCSSSSLESVTISGSNSGTFSSSPGLTI
ncbi:PKD domain-containing protein, partial [Flavobacterium sp.]|uniref:PKD domain-containing protein n=1 Tax=Flavobacterium sp. TaxID=239 RepID=UPI0037BE9F7D